VGRIADTFAQRAAENRKLLIPYLVAGDPDLDTSLTVMHEMVAAGADLIELGVPFTDPEAEGPSIQLGHERALKHNVSLRDSLALVARFREANTATPVILMGYVNPIDAMGYDNFAEKALAAGVDGTLIVNLPPEEGAELNTALRAKGLDAIYLLSPTTTDKRAAYICSEAQGFIYYVSLKGTTGSSTINFADVEARVNHLRQFSKVPMVVGFGIKDGSSAARVARFADGSVVGTALVDIFAEHQAEPEKIAPLVASLLSDMRQQMDTEAS
jgi:tryptophan synthase alpha chain